MSSFGDWIALSEVCDVPTAKLIQHEVSDGIIAPGYEPEALKILASKKKGNYNVVAIDPDYKPNPVEHKQVYGITFEQGRNELAINADTMLTNWVTENKTVTEARSETSSLPSSPETTPNPASATRRPDHRRGSRPAETASTAPVWPAESRQLAAAPRGQGRSTCRSRRCGQSSQDNAIDVYIGDVRRKDVIGDDVARAETFTEQPRLDRRRERVPEPCNGRLAGLWRSSLRQHRACPPLRRDGVIVQPGGSIRDQQVIDTCNKYGIAMAFCGIRLFHH